MLLWFPLLYFFNIVLSLATEVRLAWAREYAVAAATFLYSHSRW